MSKKTISRSKRPAKKREPLADERRAMLLVNQLDELETTVTLLAVVQSNVDRGLQLKASMRLLHSMSSKALDLFNSIVSRRGAA